ncbi:O-acetyltransferase OatA [Paraburkholderia domus]|uniref:O-acetyltransferase OatA n=1 Tax=Paraburkholderia domus TaxID=2793075 RepID=A0A9N8MP73_9BURK|nr:acyltransferase [Paraburkholderia domus]MBK5052570.1 acyltransferase [Burkholderia sp. R-70006]MBK5059580.1 acyltransferase [Burkholderia sp. R-70199]MBK5090821.1 acyltransferase [Burkholderia sp. R-69927]MBK5165019.1 acyltransferase [Burkholderia sp. R-70211]MBK5182321.1 acyltransferase [Burkholderia sp. R-69749]
MKLFGGAGPATGKRAIELDFVRGIAIIMVMGFHFHAVHTDNFLIHIVEYPLKNFGREGVNLFFTLSGFLVGGLLLRQYAETGNIDAKRFIIRRIFRIWPAYYILIAFHVLAGRHPWNTFLFQNLTHLQNYLGTSITQTWSLAVEEHFYLVLPALLLLFARWRLGAWTIVGVLTGICAVVLTARCFAVAGGNLEGAFAYTQYRIDSLLVGVILSAIYWMKPGVYHQLAKRKWLLVASIVALCAWLAFATPHFALDESIGYTIQAIGFAALIVFVLEYSGSLRSSWVYRGIAWIGLYSYGIYLWHSLALAPGDMLIRKATAMGLAPSVIWIVALTAQFAFAIAIGYVTTRAIEYPFLRMRNALFPEKRNSSVREEVPVAGGQLS